MSSQDLFTHPTKLKKKKKRLNSLPQNPEQDKTNGVVKLGRFPSWLHRPLPKGSHLWETNDVIQEKRLHTVCEEAKCPNLLECFSKKTATFLALGKECTRACGFCDIDFSQKPAPPNSKEPLEIVKSVKALGLQHVVITMVARDDLEDFGADHIKQIITTLKKEIPTCTTEVLTSDFSGNIDAWHTVLSSNLDIWNYNIETVRSLTPRVRHKASYERTLALLQFAHKNRHATMLVKSGIMLGLGETKEEVHETLNDLKQAGCDVVTMGQYLQPNKNKLLVKAFITPQEFENYAAYGHSIGIKHMYCGPFVRSSYNAGLVKRRVDNL